MRGKTELRWVYVVDLDKDICTSTQLRILGYSLEEVIDQVSKTQYRNWSVTKIARTTWVTDLRNIEGEPKMVTREIGS